LKAVFSTVYPVLSKRSCPNLAEERDVSRLAALGGPENAVPARQTN
jgi:hypothetical protein